LFTATQAMTNTELHAAQIVVLLLLLFVVAFAALAKRLNTPYPLILVIAGLLLGFVPGIPKVTLDPGLVFLVVLPPLLYSAAWLTSWRDFSYNMVSIVSLAVGLVAFTVFGVAQAAPWLFAGFTWQAGFVLGAVVAPTDAIAATSIAKRIGLPKRIVDLLEGESLVNDATGLLALEFGTAMVVLGQRPTISYGILRLLYLAGAGLALGLIIGRVVEWFELRIDDGPIEIAASIFVPYATYLAAEAVHASGVLAVVAAGLYLSRKSSHFFSSSVRLQANAVWNSLTFILNGLVFVMIGLQLPQVWAGIAGYSTTQLLSYGAIFSAFLILLRLLWVYPGGYVSFLIRTRLLHQPEKRPGGRQLFVIGWTGMRGVVALAAAMSLPDVLENGAPFPQRNLIVFLTFTAILVTLVLQGLTLPGLIRKLGLAGSGIAHSDEQQARRLILEAGLQYLEDRRENDNPELAGLYDDLAQHYQHRLTSAGGETSDANGREQYARYLDLSRELLEVERRSALQLRKEGKLNDELLREIEHELDLSNIRLDAAIKHLPKS
jgi:monovalent cation/hydrogen antiporter